MLRRAGRRPPAHPRFNEAGARAPRMLCSESKFLESRVGFNEAGARAPRMPSTERTCSSHMPASMRPGRARPGCAEFISRRHEAVDASMRPGRARPGCSAVPQVPGSTTACFNEAGARAPRMQAPYNLLAAKTKSRRFRTVQNFPCRRHLVSTSRVLANTPNLPAINMLQGFERCPVFLRCLPARTDSAELARADFGSGIGSATL